MRRALVNVFCISMLFVSEAFLLGLIKLIKGAATLYPLQLIVVGSLCSAKADSK